MARKKKASKKKTAKAFEVNDGKTGKEKKATLKDLKSVAKEVRKKDKKAQKRQARAEKKVANLDGVVMRATLHARKAFIDFINSKSGFKVKRNKLMAAVIENGISYGPHLINAVRGNVKTKKLPPEIVAELAKSEPIPAN